MRVNIMSDTLPQEYRIKLEDITYDEQNPIGRGGFGDVYKGKLNGIWQLDPVAVKVQTPGSNQGRYEFETEIRILTKYRHPNLVTLIGFCDDEDQMILVYEFMSKGSLKDHIVSTASKMLYLSWARRLMICIGAARGLNCIHTGAEPGHASIHRDVKSHNILIDDNWDAKLADFGLAKETITRPGQSSRKLLSGPAGTKGYCDPETISSHHLSKKSDIYSFGIVLLEISCGRLTIKEGYPELPGLVNRIPFGNDGDIRLGQFIDPAIRETIHPLSLKVFKNIVDQCVYKEQQERKNMTWVIAELEEALRHQQDFKPTPSSLNFSSLATKDLESDEFWEKMLPKNYEDLIKRIYYDEVYETKKDLYFLLLDGIFFDDAEKFFCLSKENGKPSVVISSSDFIDADNREDCEWGYLNESWHCSQELHLCAFSKVALFNESSKFEFKANISTQLLSPDTMYGVFMVYTEHLKLSWTRTKFILHIQNMSINNVHGDETGEVELFRFVKNEETTFLKFEVKSTEVQIETSIYLEAIWLRPLGYHCSVGPEGSVFWPTENKMYEGVSSLSLNGDPNWDVILTSDLQEIIKSADPQVVYSTKRELHAILSLGIVINNGRMWFSLSTLNTKKSYLLSVQMMSIRTDKYGDCTFVSEATSRFAEVAEVETWTWIKLQAKVDSVILSPMTAYSVYFVFKEKGHPSTQLVAELPNPPMLAVFQLDGQEEISRAVSLKFRSPFSQQKIDQQTESRATRLKVDGYPVMRDDGWTEVELVQFFNNLPDTGVKSGSPQYVKMKIQISSTSMLWYKWTHMIEGIELRPKES